MLLSFVLYFCSQIVDGLRSPSAVAVDAITTGLQVRNHLDVRTTSRCLIDLFTDKAAILNLLDLRSRYRYGEHTEEGKFKLIISSTSERRKQKLFRMIRFLYRNEPDPQLFICLFIIIIIIIIIDYYFEGGGGRGGDRYNEQ